MGTILLCWLCIFILSFVGFITQQAGFSLALMLGNLFAVCVICGMGKIIYTIKDK